SATNDMSITQDIEEKLGIKIDSLKPVEKETYFSMLQEVQKAQLSPEKMRDYISKMKDAVEKDLIDEPEFTRFLIFKFENRRQVFLKARLQNYRLLESFLMSADRAKQELENVVGNITK